MAGDRRDYRGFDVTLPIFQGLLIETHKATDISPDEILSTSRKQSVAGVRQVIQYTMRNRSQWSLPMIGKAFGRDHSTVLHAIRTVEGKLKKDEKMQSLVERLMVAPIVPFDEYDRYMVYVRDPSKPIPIRAVSLKRTAPKIALGKQGNLISLSGVQKSKIKYFASTDADGYEYRERYQAHDMIQGSALLREAILSARYG